MILISALLFASPDMPVKYPRRRFEPARVAVCSASCGCIVILLLLWVSESNVLGNKRCNPGLGHVNFDGRGSLSSSRRTLHLRFFLPLPLSLACLRLLLAIPHSSSRHELLPCGRAKNAPFPHHRRVHALVPLTRVSQTPRPGMRPADILRRTRQQRKRRGAFPRRSGRFAPYKLCPCVEA